MQRRAGAGLTVLALSAILLLTLAPEVHDTPGLPFWCVGCGALGTADVLLNVALFVPLGVGLRLGGSSVRRSLLIIIGTSLSVELLQHISVSGRDSSASDVLANSVGGALGLVLAATSGAWLFPAPRAAARLLGAAALFWIIILGLGASGLTHAPPVPIVITQHAPNLPRLTPFNGTVLDASLGNLALGDGESVAGEVVHNELESGRAFEAGFVARSTSTDLVPVVRVVDGPGGERIVVGQEGSDLVFRLRTRSTNLRLRTPEIRIPNLLCIGAASTCSDTTRVRAAFANGSLRLAATLRGSTYENVLNRSPNRAWNYVLPSPRSPRRAELLTLLWTATLAAPLGYWSGRTATSISGCIPRWLSASSSRLTVLAPVVVAIGFLLVPALFALPPIPAAEWVAAMASVAGMTALGLFTTRDGGGNRT